MLFFGILFIVSTTLVFIFKKEVELPNTESNIIFSTNHDIILVSKKKKSKSFEDNLNVKKTYKLMWQILWLPPIKKIIIILMTIEVKMIDFFKLSSLFKKKFFKIGFATESISYLKLVEGLKIIFKLCIF